MRKYVEDNGRQDFTIGEGSNVYRKGEHYIMYFLWSLNIIFHYRESGFLREKRDSKMGQIKYKMSLGVFYDFKKATL